MRGYDKVLAVAQTEFRALTRSKAFLVSVLILPVMMLVTSFLQRQVAEHADTRPRRFAVIDPSGRFYDVIDAAARARNQHLGQKLGDKRVDLTPFIPERADARVPIDELRLRLSDRVRKEELFAFVEIPAQPDLEKLRYYSDHPAYDDLREFLKRTLDEALRAERYQAAHLSPQLVDALSRHVGAEALGLWTRDASGHIRPAEKQDVIRELVVPLVPTMLLFFFVVISVPQLMNSVLTEKVTRISEVLLGSITPFQLMTGKLLGSVGVSLLLGVLYLACGIGVATRMGYAAAISTPLVAWFLFFLVLAMLLYGALSMAIGAACTDVKDAQNLMLPVMLPLMIPFFVSSAIIESPSSPLSVALSLFPPATPLVMLLRVGLHPSPPVWQVAVGAALTIVVTVGCIWAAGRIFRVGLLAQGKSAGLGQMVRWIFTS